MLLMLVSHFSCVRLCAIPETAAYKAPLSLGFSRQEHWSGLPLPSPVILSMLFQYIDWKWNIFIHYTEWKLQLSSVTQSCPTLCAHGLQHARLPCLITNSRSLLKLISIESVMPSNHLILCRLLLLPPSIFLNLRVF